MDLYVSQPRGYAANFPRQIMRVAKLYQSGFLDDDSSVWINTNAISPVFWCYNGRGTAIYWFDAPTAGSVRITRDRVRWASSYSGTQDSPLLDLSLASLNVLNKDSRLTFVVDNTFHAPGATVNIAEGRESDTMVGGYWEGSFGIAVLDLPRFDRTQLPSLTESRRDYEHSLARYQGLQLLYAGMKAEGKSRVVDNTDDYRVTLSREVLGALTQSLDAFSTTASSISETLFTDHTDTAEDD
ncbi:hypothetical protein [Gordonia malaquae]|uniref:hypothetical protein n=1 Tax=Gordonia malaquae TaxID=410332 RepID=UPI0030183611